jgi:hypothetical protein
MKMLKINLLGWQHHYKTEDDCVGTLAKSRWPQSSGFLKALIYK